MGNILKFLWIAAVLTLAVSCSKDYGYNFEDGVNVGAEEASGKLDTNMSFVDKSLYNRARIFPGVVGAQEPRVKDKKVIMDLNYVPAGNLRVSVAPYGIHSTGLYAPTGELIKIVVPEGVDDLVIQIGVHTDNLTGKLNLQRDPIIFTVKSLFPGVNYIRSLYGGTIWIKSRTPIAKPVELTFTNAVEAPDFVLGEMTNAEWHDKIKKSTVPWLEMRSKNVVFSISREMVMRFVNRGKVEDPTLLMQEWDKVYEYDYYNWMGLTKGNTDHKHRAPDLPERGVVDIQISVGYGHNGYPWMGILDEEWSGTMVDLSVMMSGQGWGTWHEVGHNYQQGNWSWNGLGETTNNLFIFKTANRLTRDYGKKVFPSHPALAEQFPLALTFAADPNSKDFDKNDNPFFKLVPFLQIFNKASNPSTGQDGWPFMAYLYSKTRNATLMSNNIQDRKDFFYESLCEYTQKDYIRFMNAWGIYVSPQSRRTIAAKGYPKLTKEVWKYNPITGTGGETTMNPKYDHPRNGWAVLNFSTEEPAEGAAPMGRAVAVLDGNINTYWHTQWSGANPPPPHHITLDTKDELSVRGFYFVTRQNAANGRPRKVKILVSNDNLVWNDLGSHDLQNITARQEITLTASVKARYLKFVFEEVSYQGVHATMAEIGTFDVDNF